MRRTFPTLCAILLLGTAALSSPAMAGAPVIETAGFSLGGPGSQPITGVALVSELPGHATFSLWGINHASHVETNSRGEQFTDVANDWERGYSLAVKDGYRITGITLEGEFYGALRPAQWSTTGDAGNSMGLGFAVHRPGQPPRDWRVSHQLDIDGREQFRLEMAPALLTGDLELSLAGYAKAWASSVWYQDGAGEEYWMGSFADGGVRNLTMTFTVAPVPEPGMHAMLLGGLGLLAMAARRRAKT